MADDQPCTDVGVQSTSHPPPPVLPKSSPLLDLAAEIRLKIIQYALPPTGQEYRVCKQSNHANPAAQLDGHKCVEYNRKSCPGILLVNKQMYNEGLEFLHGVKQFSFCSPICMDIFLRKSKKEHIQEVSHLCCPHSAPPSLTQETQQPNSTDTQLTLSISGETQQRQAHFIDQVRRIIEQGFYDATWERRLSIESITGSEATMPTSKWTFSLSRISAPDTKQVRRNQFAAHLLLAAEGKDIAAVPITSDYLSMMAGIVDVRQALKASALRELGPQFALPLHYLLPPLLQEYLLPQT